MERSSEKEESGEELHQQLKKLEQDWNSFKQSNPERSQVRNGWSNSILELLKDTPPRDLTSLPQRHFHPLPPSDGGGGCDTPPRDLTSLPQRHSHPLPPSEGGGGCEVRNNDLGVEEILGEKRVTIESGKLKGRWLLDLDALDSACSGCSSVSIRGSEVRSICFSSDDDDNDGKNGFHHENAYSLGGYFLSSSTGVSAEKGVAGVAGKGRIRRGSDGYGERWMLLMGCLAIVLTLSALGIISLWSFEGSGDQQSFDNLIVT